MKLLVTVSLFFCALAAAGVLGCTQQKSPDQLKEQTAKKTAELKQDAKAIAQGVREGWNRDSAVNLNTASKEQLMQLPGISSPEADRVVAGRPYKQPQDLVARHILSKSEFDKISSRITTQ